jgi:uncharacterized protein YjiS (DUF1127 family)
MLNEWMDYWQKEISATKRYYSIINELSKLSDRELADIGINRGDILYLAMENHRK